MVNENNIIPKENFKKTEIVQEIKTEIPSLEEFMKTYESDGRVSESYEGEFRSCGDISVAKGYGPGNNMSAEDEGKLKQGVTGVATGIGLIALTVACPPAGVATTAVVGGAGFGAKVAKNFAPKDSDTYEALNSVGNTCQVASTVGGTPSGARWVKNKVTRG